MAEHSAHGSSDRVAPTGSLIAGMPARSSPHQGRKDGAHPMNINIRTRLNILVLAAILPLLLLAGAFLWERSNDDHLKVEFDARNAATLGAARIDDYLNNMNTLLRTIGRSISGDAADVEKNDALLRAVRADLPAYVSNVLVADLKGHNIGTSQWPLTDKSRTFVGDRPYFNERSKKEGSQSASQSLAEYPAFGLLPLRAR